MGPPTADNPSEHIRSFGTHGDERGMLPPNERATPACPGRRRDTVHAKQRDATVEGPASLSAAASAVFPWQMSLDEASATNGVTRSHPSPISLSVQQAARTDVILRCAMMATFGVICREGKVPIDPSLRRSLSIKIRAGTFLTPATSLLLFVLLQVMCASGRR